MFRRKFLRSVLAGGLCVSLCIGTGIPAVKAAEPSVVSESTDAADGSAKKRMVENLSRGLVAVKSWNGIYLSWRFLANDSENLGFDVYRDGVKITSTPITDSTNYLDTEGDISDSYTVHAVLDGEDIEVSESVNVHENSYFDIPLQQPAAGMLADGSSYTYSPGDASCGDLDGDGEYEIVLKWNPSNYGDNMADGFRGNIYLDAYEMDGTLLWRIDMGKNIRAGEHYTPFLVYDFDEDGRAEVVFKTADGTVDGKGNVIGDADADWRGPNGEIITGPEYLTLFDGYTGENLDTVDYEVARGDTNDWGDSFGNRSERYLAAVAYLDGETPSIVMCRGYYVRTSLSAWDVVDKKLVKRWIFDSNNGGCGDYAGQGNHNLAVADADGDGYDEIVYGACTIDHDGTGLYSTGLGHGDALHVGDFDPEREGLEVFQVHEHAPYGASLRAAEDGTIIWRHEAGSDTGRGIAGNFLPDNPGAEFAAVSDNVLYNTKGEAVGNWSDITKWSQNFAVYWDGNLEREVMDRTVVDGYGGRILTASGVYAINGTKSVPALSADLFGDWREEIIWPSYESMALRVYTTTYQTDYRICTLMHDTQYRCQVASQNVGYNQPPNTSYFLGTGYDLPKQPEVVYVGTESGGDETDTGGGSTTGDDTNGGNTGGDNDNGSNINGGGTDGGNINGGNTGGDNGGAGADNPAEAEQEAKAKAQAGTISSEESQKAITSADTDKGDVKGSSFAAMKLKAKEGSKSVKLSWSKVSGADGYLIYGAACGSKMKQIAKVSASKKSYTARKLEAGRYYKYMVTAYKNIYGEKRIISTSVTIHCATKGGKYGNPTGISYSKKTVTVKLKKTITLKPVMQYKKKVKTHIAKIRYESSNPKVATVTKKGKVKGIKKGSCYIYMYTQNGLYRRVKVTVS